MRQLELDRLAHDGEILIRAAQGSELRHSWPLSPGEPQSLEDLVSGGNGASWLRIRYQIEAMEVPPRVWSHGHHSSVLETSMASRIVRQADFHRDGQLPLARQQRTLGYPVKRGCDR
jgi:hypothetical protein